MTRTTSIDILDGLTSSVAFKGPCALGTTANVTLHGEQTIDGTLTDETRVLVMNQTVPSENGIYVTSTGDWRRTKDFSRNDDIVVGTSVVVSGGATKAGIWLVTFSGELAMDTTSLSFLSLTTVLGYAGLASPVFTGNPQVPTASPGDNDTTIASTAFVAAAVAAAIAALINSAPGALDTLDELAAALGDDANFAATMTAALAACLKNNVEDQTLTGGARVTSKSLGTITTGTLTLDTGDRPVQHYTNGGAHTLSPGANGGSIQVDITNNGSAGAITVSGYTKVIGAFDTTNGHVFRCWSSVGNGGSMLVIQPMF
jgi:hypothetical protein